MSIRIDTFFLQLWYHELPCNYASISEAGVDLIVIDQYNNLGTYSDGIKDACSMEYDAEKQLLR